MDGSGSAVVREDLQYMAGNLPVELAALAGKSVLITGGAGFLGYYLVQVLVHWNQEAAPDRRIRITVYDNYSRGLPAWLAELATADRVTLVAHDMALPLPTVGEIFHYLIHAAGIASPVYYRLHPIETMDANINGLRNLLEYARGGAGRSRAPEVSGILYFSSSEIYGDPPPESIPTPEDYRGNVSCTGPRACYDETKRFGETLCVNFARQYGVPVKIARPFNNYGPGLKITDRRVLPDFARNVLAGTDIVLLSDGTPRRTFCYAADAIVGYYKVLVNGRPGEPYNIGVEGPEISMRELAQLMADTGAELCGYRGRVVCRPSPEPDYLADNPARRCPVIAKARQELGYEPTISLAEGLRRTLLWYHDNRIAEEA